MTIVPRSLARWGLVLSLLFAVALMATSAGCQPSNSGGGGGDGAEGEGEGEGEGEDEGEGEGEGGGEGEGESDGEGEPELAVPVMSQFDTDDNGWRLDGGAFSAPTAPVYSDGEQYVYAENADFGYWVAPQAFRGNYLAALGLGLEFESAWIDGCCNTMPRVVLAGGGVTIVHSPDYDPAPSGSWFWVLLDETEEWFNQDTGLRATGDELRTVLADLSQLKLLAGASGFSWIDNVMLGTRSELRTESVVEATFTGSDEGWRLSGGNFALITTPTHDPENGYLSTLDAGFAAWRSSSTFRGDFSNFVGGTLVIDESWEDGCCSSSARVALYGGGFIISTSFGSDPTETIDGFSVQLTESQQWQVSAANTRATGDQINAVLSSLQGIRILTGASGVSRLDRVRLSAN